MAKSWQLKARRSYEHFQEIKGRVGAMVDPSRSAVRIEKHRRGKTWYYTLHYDVLRDEMLPVIVGEMLFNLRSALDHIAVANVPRKYSRQVQFPIFVAPIWEKNLDGSYAHADDTAREAWDRYTRGMKPSVLAVVEWAQPYNAPRRDDPREPQHDALYLLSVFQNADKHRELNILVTGLTDVTAWNSVDMTPFDFSKTHAGIFKDGAQFMTSEFDVSVQVRGTFDVALTRGGQDAAHYRLLETLEQIHMEVLILLGAIESEM